MTTPSEHDPPRFVVVSVIRTDPEAVVGVVVTSWLLALTRGFEPWHVCDDVVHLGRPGDRGDEEVVRVQIEGLLAERRFHGWRVSAVDSTAGPTEIDWSRPPFSIRPCTRYLE